MNALTKLAHEPQVIYQHGEAAFVVLEIEEYQRLQGQQALSTGIPAEVVQEHIINEVPIFKAWREYLRFSQQEIADKAGISQPALAKLEAGHSQPRHTTLEKIAKAMDLRLEQLEI